MHIQVRSSTEKTGFEDGEPGEIAISRDFKPGALLEMLGILKGAGFNLRAAGGPRVELGGEFAFWVDRREGAILAKVTRTTRPRRSPQPRLSRAPATTPGPKRSIR